MSPGPARESVGTIAPGGSDRFLGLYRGWWIVALSFTLYAVASGPIFYAFAVFGQSFAKEFGASRTLINSAFTAVTVVSSLAQLVVGTLADRLALKRILCIGAVAVAGSLDPVMGDVDR